MANSHVSYLQTLPNEEAIAFVSSLQKVKEHLSQELQWMNEQVQHKTVQMQGIETLLSEAASLGFATATTTATENSTEPVTAPIASHAAVTMPDKALPDGKPFAAVNGNNLAAKPLPKAQATSVSAPSDATPVTPAPPRPVKQRQPQKPAKFKRDATPAVGKTSAPNAKKIGRSTPSVREAPSASEASKATDLSSFQQFIQTRFQTKSMTDAVGEILEDATEPLNTDAIMTQLYRGLATEDYQRAKSSLSNILSVGKTKGKWKSPARGLYIGK